MLYWRFMDSGYGRNKRKTSPIASDIVSAYHQLRTGSMRVAEAKEIANLAGKAMNGVKAQLEFAKINKTNAPKECMEFVDVE